MPSYMFSYGNGLGGGGGGGGVKREVAALVVDAACEKVILVLHSSVPVMLPTDAN